MDLNEGLISEVSTATNLEFVLCVGQKNFHLENVSINRSKIPVRKPTMRGGVYFTDVMAYKVRATTRDMSILELLPAIMLGPNTEFQPVEVRTYLSANDTPKEVVLVAHVSNTVNTKEKVELYMIIDGTRP